MEDHLRCLKLKGKTSLRQETKRCGIWNYSLYSKDSLIKEILNRNGQKVKMKTWSWLELKMAGPGGLFELAKKLGIKSATIKSKEKLVEEITWRRNAWRANRMLQPPDYYEDLCDDELVKDLFDCNVRHMWKYSEKYDLGHVNGSRKVQYMENLFVKIRSGRYTPMFVVSYEEVDNRPMKTVRDVIYEKCNLIFTDQRSDWDRESLTSYLLLLGCNNVRLDDLKDKELLSLLIRLESCSFFARFYDRNILSRVDLRDRFYKGRENVASEGFFIDRKRELDLEKGRIMRERTEEREAEAAEAWC